MKQISPYTVGAVVIIGIIYIMYFGTVLPTQSIVGISEIKYGSISNGQLIGAKYVVSTSLATTEDTILVTTKDAGLIFGQYRIMPKKNLKIVMSATNPNGVTNLDSYTLNYYGNTRQLSSYLGKQWYYSTPYMVKIYADDKVVPDTLISSQTISEIGQAWTPIGSGINTQRTSIAFIGPYGLPDASSIAVLTIPSYTSLGLNSGNKVVLKSSLDSKLSNFNAIYNPSQFPTTLNDPVQALWTGYDKYQLIGFNPCSGIYPSWPTYQGGYCKIPGWNGLSNEAQSPSYSVPIQYVNNQVRVDNIDFGVNVNLEIPSEIVESIAVLIGVGKPEIVSVNMPATMYQGTSYTASITVKNSGDTDGFVIQPISTTNRYTFTPGTYSETLTGGQEKTYSFQVNVNAPTTTNEFAETVSWEVRATHNPVKAIKTTVTNTIYTIPTTTTPGGTPTPTPQPGGHSITRVNWYDSLWLWLGVLLIVLGIIVYKFGDDI